MARRCFFSFHYEPDNSRAAQVRNMGMVDGNRPVSDNDWESITRGGDRAIRNWIGDQLHGRSCTIVLVGTTPPNGSGSTTKSSSLGTRGWAWWGSTSTA